MNIPLLIKTKRKLLGESGTDFGKRFGVTHAAVSDWEAGKSEASYKVIEFVLQEYVEKFFCPYCKGTGLLANTPPTISEKGTDAK